MLGPSCLLKPCRILDSRIYVANAPPPFPTQYMPSSLQDMLRPDFYWNHVFESFPYPRKYGKFVKIFLSASDKDELGDWVGCVKSRFRCLTIKVCDLRTDLLFLHRSTLLAFVEHELYIYGFLHIFSSN